MKHSERQLIDKVLVMRDKAILLERERYGTIDNKYDKQTVENLIADIQALAGDIYNDRDNR